LLSSPEVLPRGGLDIANRLGFRRLKGRIGQGYAS
jgi:hypothetical protein